MSNDTYSFVVRIWREGRDSLESAIVWRGSVDDVASGERFHFSDLGDIAGFIRRQVHFISGHSACGDEDQNVVE